jgi:hypothetical protein
MDQRSIVYVMARCARHLSGYGLRFEQARVGLWLATSSFAMSDVVAEREGHHHTQIRGAFELASTFPGCPHCGARSFFRCLCGKVACWDGVSKLVTCPTCGNRIEVDRPIVSLEAGAG